MNAAEHKALPFSANQTGPGAKSAPGADAAHAGHTKKRPAANAAGRENFIFFAVLLTGSGSHTAPLRLRFFISPHDAFCTVRTIWGGPYSTELLQTAGYFQTSLQSLLNPVFSRIALISSTVRSYCQYLMSLTGFPFLKVPL